MHRIPTMNESPLKRLADAYLASLRRHCVPGPLGSLEAAHELGEEAVAIGLETLDLAGIHGHALSQLLAADDSAAKRTDLTLRATAFFTEAIIPIEGTHRAALKSAADMTELHAALDERTVELVDANGELQRQVAERAAAESTLRNSQRSARELLNESRVLEGKLQQMTHQILSATETERQRMSLQLNDEIAQTLLGIQLRILALDNEVAANRSDLSREIAATQQLATAATITVRRLVQEFSNPHER